MIPKSPFLRKARMQLFAIPLLYFLYRRRFKIEEVIKSLCPHTSGGISYRSPILLRFIFRQNYFIFFLHKLSKFDVYLAIHNFCDRFIDDFRRVSKQILGIFFPLLYSLFSAGSFKFCSRDVLPFAHCFLNDT